MTSAPIFREAICRLPAPDFASGITVANLGVPDFATMLAQHAAYVTTLRSLGVDVLVLDALAGFPDAYFVEDCALMFPELGIVTRPGAVARRGEEAAMAEVIARFRPTADVRAPGTLDGGDVLVVGKQVLVGLSQRTNEAGVAELGRILTPHGYTVTALTVGAGLHFKSSVNWLGGRRLLVTQAFHDAPELSTFDLYIVDPAEEYAANSLLVNGTILTPRGFPKTRTLLQSLGTPVVELDTSEARKMDGGLTCLSLRF